MRVLVLVQNYPPEKGAVRYTRDLAVYLATCDASVRVVTGLPHYPSGRSHPGFGRFLPTRRQEDGVEVTRVPLVMGGNHQIIRRIAGFLTFPLTALVAALFSHRPDVVIASLPPLTVGPLGFLLARLFRARLVFLLRDVEPLVSFEIRGVSHRPWARRAIAAGMWLYRRADHVVVVHESQAEVLIDAGMSAEGLDVIDHGVDLAAFDALATTHRATLPRRPGRALALYAGSFGVAQDLVAMIEAFAAPAIRSLPIDLMLVGDGECRAKCLQAVRKHQLDSVQVLDAVALENMPSLLQSADLLVVSYVHSHRPIAGMIGSKFYEYCAAGKCVLVHGPGMGAQLVEKIGNGWTCKAGEPEDLSAALSRFLAADHQQHEIGLRGRQFAEAHYAKEKRHLRWWRLLDSLCSNDVNRMSRGSQDHRML